MIYHVEYVDAKDGEVHTKTFDDCHDVGNAFRKCLKKFPGCTLIRATTHRRMFGRDLWMEYKPPSTKGVVPLASMRMEQPDLITNDPRRVKERKGRR
jgi:hypothetical protein